MLVKKVIGMRVRMPAAGYESYGSGREGPHEDLVLTAGWAGMRSEPCAAYPCLDVSIHALLMFQSTRPRAGRDAVLAECAEGECAFNPRTPHAARRSLQNVDSVVGGVSIQAKAPRIPDAIDQMVVREWRPSRLCTFSKLI